MVEALSHLVVNIADYSCKWRINFQAKKKKGEKRGIIYAGRRMGQEFYLKHEQHVESKESEKKNIEKQSKE